MFSTVLYSVMKTTMTTMMSFVDFAVGIEVFRHDAGLKQLKPSNSMLIP